MIELSQHYQSVKNGDLLKLLSDEILRKLKNKLEGRLFTDMQFITVSVDQCIDPKWFDDRNEAIILLGRTYNDLTELTNDQIAYLMDNVLANITGNGDVWVASFEDERLVIVLALAFEENATTNRPNFHGYAHPADLEDLFGREFGRLRIGANDLNQKVRIDLSKIMKDRESSEELRGRGGRRSSSGRGRGSRGRGRDDRDRRNLGWGSDDRDFRDERDEERLPHLDLVRRNGASLLAKVVLNSFKKQIQKDGYVKPVEVKIERSSMPESIGGLSYKQWGDYITDILGRTVASEFIVTWSEELSQIPLVVFTFTAIANERQMEVTDEDADVHFSNTSAKLPSRAEIANAVLRCARKQNEADPDAKSIVIAVNLPRIDEYTYTKDNICSLAEDLNAILNESVNDGDTVSWTSADQNPLITFTFNIL